MPRCKTIHSHNNDIYGIIYLRPDKTTDTYTLKKCSLQRVSIYYTAKFVNEITFENKKTPKHTFEIGSHKSFVSNL